MTNSSPTSALLHKLITFYSYKGGTGRSMALANVACLLARSFQTGDRILAIDWDLEAPGLHYYLLPPDAPAFSRGHEGVVELFTELQRAVADAHQAGSGSSPEPHQIVLDVDLSRFVINTRVDNVLLMPAGVFDDTYQARLAAIGWETLYKQSPDLYQSFARQLSQDYAAVLIDSRTGLTDTSNICTTLLPDKLVVVFTPNLQSLSGVEVLIKQSLEYRSNSPDVRELMVYPLPSRIDGQYDNLRKLWRSGDSQKGVEGYEKQFTRILKNAYSLSECNLFKYFEEIQIQHSPEYSYGEPVVALDPETSDRFSLLRSYVSLVNWINSSAPPWEEPELGRARQRLESLRRNMESGEYSRSSQSYIDMLREIVSLSTAIFGSNDPDTIDITQKLIEASLSDLGARAGAIELLGNLGQAFPSLAPAVRWGVAECFLNSAATLRKFGDPRVTQLRAEVKALIEIDSEFNTELGLSTFLVMAKRLRNKGDLIESRLVLELVVDGLVSYSGEIGLKIDALGELARIREALGDLSGAIHSYKLAVQLLLYNRGAEHSDTLSAVRRLADALTTKGDLAEAASYREQMVAIASRTFGESAPETLESLTSLADTLERMGQIKGDAALLKRAVEVRKRASGGGDSSTIAAEEKLASLQGIQRSLREAIGELESARASDSALQSTASKLNVSLRLQEVGLLRDHHGESDLALQAYQEALAILRPLATATGPASDQQMNLASLLSTIGDLQSRQERYQEALSHYLEAYRIAATLMQNADKGKLSGTEIKKLRDEIQERIEETRLQTVADARL